MLSLAEVRREIPENLKDHWIFSLRTMLLGSDDTKQYSGLQALSICAEYGKQKSFYPSPPSLTPTKDEFRKKILEANIISHLVKLFQSRNDAVKYCASQALIAVHGGSVPDFYATSR